MQMYPGAGYKEQHHYKVEKDDFMYRDDFHFNKGSGPSMHMKKPDHQYTTADHHRNHGKLGPNMHMMMKPSDHNNPNNNQHHNYGGYHGPNKHGMNYSETIYEQEEKQFHNFSGHHNYGKANYGGREGGGYVDHHNYGMPNYGGNERYYSDERKNGLAVWDSKGMDD